MHVCLRSASRGVALALLKPDNLTVPPDTKENMLAVKAFVIISAEGTRRRCRNGINTIQCFKRIANRHSIGPADTLNRTKHDLSGIITKCANYRPAIGTAIFGPHSFIEGACLWIIEVKRLAHDRALDRLTPYNLKYL